MQNRTAYAAGFVTVLVIAVIFMLRVLSGPEDSWICQDGRWVRHGNPASNMPSSQCK